MFSLAALGAVLVVVACEPDRPVISPDEDEPAEIVELADWVPSTRSENLEDGAYRGWFGDGGEMQVNVQFTLESNVVTSARFRHLAYRGTDYRDDDEDPIAGIARQHEVALEHLVDRDIRGALRDLYFPGEIVGDEYDVDGFTGATIRSTKIRSAVRDALNSGPYGLAD